MECRITVSSHCQDLTNCMYQLQQKGLLCDAGLECKDGVVYIHKLVLLSCDIPYFYHQVPTGTSLSKCYIGLRNFTLRSVCGLVQILYTGRLRLFRDYLNEFIELCSFLGLVRIKAVVQSLLDNEKSDLDSGQNTSGTNQGEMPCVRVKTEIDNIVDSTSEIGRVGDEDYDDYHAPDKGDNFDNVKSVTGTDISFMDKDENNNDSVIQIVKPTIVEKQAIHQAEAQVVPVNMINLKTRQNIAVNCGELLENISKQLSTSADDNLETTDDLPLVTCTQPMDIVDVVEDIKPDRVDCQCTVCNQMFNQEIQKINAQEKLVCEQCREQEEKRTETLEEVQHDQIEQSTNQTNDSDDQILKDDEFNCKHNRPKDFIFGEHDDRNGDMDFRNNQNNRKRGSGSGGNRRNYRVRRRSGDHHKGNRSDYSDSRNSDEDYNKNRRNYRVRRRSGDHHKENRSDYSDSSNRDEDYNENRRNYRVRRRSGDHHKEKRSDCSDSSNSDEDYYKNRRNYRVRRRSGDHHKENRSDYSDSSNSDEEYNKNRRNYRVRRRSGDHHKEKRSDYSDSSNSDEDYNKIRRNYRVRKRSGDHHKEKISDYSDSSNSDEDYNKNRRNYRGRRRSGDHHKEKRSEYSDSRSSDEDYNEKSNFRRSGDSSKHDSRGRGRGRNDNYYNRHDSSSSGEDIYEKRDSRNSGELSRPDSRGRGGQNYKGSDDGNRHSGEFRRNNYKDKREQFEDSEFEPTRKRPCGGCGSYYYHDVRTHGGSHNYHDDRTHGGSHYYRDDRNNGGSRKYNDDIPAGPPPDPINPLSDKYREEPQERREGATFCRRHPINFGGQDFSNVKSQMKNMKEREVTSDESSDSSSEEEQKQAKKNSTFSCYPFITFLDKNKTAEIKKSKKKSQNRPAHQKSKMERAATMTERERKQYKEWKAERKRVDRARIERQKSSSGEWKREWDKEKLERVSQPTTTPSQLEL